MPPSLVASTTAGAIFGSALTLSGVYSPLIIMSQMQLSNSHMLQTFLAASGCSTLAIHLTRTRTPIPPRTSSSLTIFPYDANIIGGLLLGMGMTLTGACPGTVLVQLGTGIRSGYFAFLGGVVGGALYGVVRGYLAISTSKAGVGEESEGGKAKDEVKTVHQYFDMEEDKLVLLYESLLVPVLLLASLSSRAENVLFPPVLGGCLIGIGQVASLVLTGSAVGVSGAYGQLGPAAKQAWRYFSGHDRGGGENEKLGLRPSYNSIAFAAGIVLGSWVLSRLMDLKVPGGDAPIKDLTAVFGGAVMVVGARIAGGCTSGHGISGMATFSIASIISVAAMFSGGMGLALLV